MEKTHKKHNKQQKHSEDRSAGVSTESSEEIDPDVYYLIPRNVTMLYGPYMYLGMMDYRTDRLQGLKSFVEKKVGVTVTMTACVDHVNLCRLWFLDEPVFSCKITDLMHGGDGELDPLCLEAAEKIESYIKDILKGLRKQRPATPEDIKKPFCPCLQMNRGTSTRHTPKPKSLMSGSTSSSSPPSDWSDELEKTRRSSDRSRNKHKLMKRSKKM